MFAANQQAEFGKRDRGQLVSAFNRVAEHWQNKRWLGLRNRYGRDCVKHLTEDLHSPPQVIHKHLTEYIAASAITHSFDGWAFYGRALHALLMGDHDAARHLGYYSELRAAMGVLAAQGIGVFDREHIVVDKRGRCVQMPPYRKPGNPNRPTGLGTHRFVWEALQEWANAPISTPQILDLIVSGGCTLQDWIDHAGAIPAFAAKVTGAWLRDWGLDISRLANDRDARNIASYRPSALTTPRPANVESVSRFALALWAMAQPSTENPFAVLDRLLIKSSVHRAFTARFGYSPRRAKKKFRDFVSTVVASLQPAALPGTDWTRYLTDLNAMPVDILAFAAGEDDIANSQHPMQVLARALLLLRLSAGMSRQLIRSLPQSIISHLDFWVTNAGEDRALWPLNGRPTSLMDLWNDVEGARTDIDTNLTRITSFNLMWRDLSASASVLTSWERVGLWSLGL
jgi:hypothetical protein